LFLQEQIKDIIIIKTVFAFFVYFGHCECIFEYFMFSYVYENLCAFFAFYMCILFLHFFCVCIFCIFGFLVQSA